MIIYTPIDISVKLPNYTRLKEYFNINRMYNLKETTGYTSQMCAVASRNSVSNWKDATDVFKPDNDTDFDLTYNSIIYYAPGIQEQFPELVDILNLLPYKQIVGAALNMHTELLPTHRDRIYSETAVSPARYNVLLSPHFGQDSFYLTNNFNSKKVYPTILEEYPIYAFNNNDVYHGADIILDDRIILVCMGVLDNGKHQQLIEQSTTKFKEYVIHN